MCTSPEHEVLIVDVDGTLTPADTLQLLRMRYLIRHPLRRRDLRRWKSESKQAEKIALWNEVPFKTPPPLNRHVIDFVREWQRPERLVHVVTGSSEGLARFVVTHARLTCLVSGSSDTSNLTKAAKAQFILDQYPNSHITYIGDSQDDLSVWKVCDQAVCVGWSTSDASSVTTRSGSRPIRLPQVPVRRWVFSAIRLLLA